MEFRQKEMIRLYYRGNCGSSRRAIEWFEKYSLQVEKIKIDQITKKDLINLLSFTDEGMQGVVKRAEKSNSITRKSLNKLINMTFNEAIEFLLYHTNLLQTHIILEGKNILTGYNEDDIRKLSPREYRRRNL